MKKLTAAAVLAAAVSSGAAENLLMNGSLQSNLGKFPPYWAYVNSTGGKYEYHTSGGPDNRPFIRLISRGDTLALKQNNLTLVRGEKYRLSAYFRTRNLVNKESGISVGTGPWAKFNKTNSLFGLPRNLSQWRKIEKIITIDPAVEDENYKFYTVDIAVKRGGGEMEHAGILHIREMYPFAYYFDIESISGPDLLYREDHLRTRLALHPVAAFLCLESFGSNSAYSVKFTA